MNRQTHRQICKHADRDAYTLGGGMGRDELVISRVTSVECFDTGGRKDVCLEHMMFVCFVVL